MNQASRNILGYEPEELLKMNFRDLVEDDYLSCVEENFRKKKQQESTVTGPYEVRVKTGGRPGTRHGFRHCQELQWTDCLFKQTK